MWIVYPSLQTIFVSATSDRQLGEILRIGQDEVIQQMDVHKAQCPGNIASGLQILHGGQGRTVGAVSYTHLDVYKRQVLHNQDPRPAGSAVCGRSWAGWKRIPPVSYTHLDVYKRQGATRCGRACCFWPAQVEQGVSALTLRRTRSRHINAGTASARTAARFFIGLERKGGRCCTAPLRDVYKRQPYEQPGVAFPSGPLSEFAGPP